MNAKIIPVSPLAAHAIHAAKLERRCGRYPAQCYCINHNVPPNLLRIALQLLADHRATYRANAMQQRQAEQFGY